MRSVVIFLSIKQVNISPWWGRLTYHIFSTPVSSRQGETHETGLDGGGQAWFNIRKFEGKGDQSIARSWQSL
jgi:hypothetical protein